MRYDQDFTHWQGVELSDGLVIAAAQHRRTMAALVHGEPPDIDCEELVQHAVCALIGPFGTGHGPLCGVVTIDFDAGTITDENNADVVLGDRMPWET